MQAPTWLGVAVQVLSAVVSIIAVVGFIKAGQKTKVEQAEAMMELAHSIKAIADAQQRSDTKVEEALVSAKAEHTTIWNRIDEIKDKQTRLCALHTVNHPAQTL